MTTPQIALSASIVTLSDYWYNLFEERAEDLGLGDIYYGDQRRLATTPAVCVEPSEKQNNYRSGAASRKMEPEIEISIILYHSDVASPQYNRREADRMGEVLEDLIHTKRTMDGLVIHCYVTSLKSGYIERGNTVMRACQLVITHKTQRYLPS